MISAIEIVTGAALFICILYGLYVRFSLGKEEFTNYVREDGPIEYLTAIFLFFCSLVCLYRVFQYRKTKMPLQVVTWAVLAFLFFFAAGDEISWGQRIFDIESGEFFQEHNKQKETNIHNLIVRGENLNMLIFSRMVFVVLVIYFVFLRLMVRKILFIRNLQNKFQVPLPKNHQIVAMLVASLMIAIIQLSKGSELNELSFGMIFFMIFLNPVNSGSDA